MNHKSKLFGLIIISLIIHMSCSKEQKISDLKLDNYSIKSIISNGKTSTKYIYNSIGKIAESHGFYFFNRYIYDDNGILIKKEGTAPILSSILHERRELMTSQNSTISNYSVFEYNQDGKVEKIKNYYKKNGKFDYTSMISLDYEGNNIVKWNLHDADNIITQFYLYEYDNNENVIKSKYYSYLFNTGLEPKLIRETSFKYDDKNNPFVIYKDLGRPGLYTNTNNIIESNSILYEDMPGIDKYSTSSTNYEYNSKGLPVKVSSENSEHEYKYE